MNPSKSFGWISRMNLTLLASIIGALLVGVAFVYSACSIREADALRRLYLLHAQMGVIGLLLCVGLAYINYQDILRARWLFYAGTLVLLVLTLLIGDKTMGARRWVAGVQPSELAKLATILVLAEWLGRREAIWGRRWSFCRRSLRCCSWRVSRRARSGSRSVLPCSRLCCCWD
jgi:cell division protein FtsW (lipid II flippase)